MLKFVRLFALALCLLTLGLAVPAPARATAAPPPSFTAGIRLIQEVTVVGGGPTETEALNNALASLNASYRVLRYDITNSFCTEIELPQANPLFPPQTVTLCAVEVHAWVLRRAVILSSGS